ncbi:hypothetical protein C5167_030600 [Papaver somniferum]|nr:hypothetical protein C5167_030600 [Papaver somniferum]
MAINVETDIRMEALTNSQLWKRGIVYRILVF